MKSPAELLLAVGIIIATARYAVFRDASGLFWALVAIMLTALAIVFIPIPYLRLGMALMVTVIALEAWHRRL